MELKDKLVAILEKYGFSQKAEEVKEEKFEDVLLADGETTATIEPAIEVGAAIVLTASDGTPVAAPAGEYELEDGRVVVVVEEGIVAEIREASTEEVEEEEMSDDSHAEKVKRIVESVITEKQFTTDISKVVEENEFLKKEVEAMHEKYDNLEKFTKEALNEVVELLGKEPKQEPKVEQKTSLEAFSKEEDPLAAWLSKHN